jgi:hypothetical protein
MRSSIGELKGNRIGVLDVLEGKERAANKLAGDGLAGIGALGVHHDLRLRLCRARDVPRRDSQREIGLQTRNHDMCLAVIDVHRADLRAWATR